MRCLYIIPYLVLKVNSDSDNNYFLALCTKLMALHRAICVGVFGKGRRLRMGDGRFEKLRKLFLNAFAKLLFGT